MSDTTQKRVGLVGHCRPDSSHLTMAVTAAVPDAKVIRVTDDHGVDQLLKDGVDLLLVNRKMEHGYAEEIGTDYIRRLREKNPNVKMMLISNFPDAIEESVGLGALAGFGKNELLTPATKQKLQDALK
jgi:two-component SAPR family response regulator